MHLADLNWLAVIVSAVAFYAFGGSCCPSCALELLDLTLIAGGSMTLVPLLPIQDYAPELLTGS